MRRALSCVAVMAGLLAASAAMAQEQTPAPTSQPAPAPARVTLNLEGASAEEAFDQIAKQAGIDVIIDNPSIWAQSDLVFLNVKDAPFWPTFIKLCQQARVHFDQGYGRYGQNLTRSVRLFNSGGESRFARLPMTDSDGFVIFAQSAQRNYSLSYENPANASRSFFVQLMVLPDPGLSVVSLRQPVVSEAVDENGLSLMPLDSTARTSFGTQPNQLIQQTGVSLNYPAKGGKKIARLKGQLPAICLVRAEKVEIAKPLAARQVKKELPDYDVIIDTLKSSNENDKNNRSYQLKVTFRGKQKRDGQGGVVRGESRDYWSLMNTISLTDADGKRWGNGGGGGGGSEGSYECNMYFSPNGEMGVPAKLEWTLPAETKELRIPFELKDMPIP